MVQSSPEDDDQPIESGRIINLNKVQVLPNFSRMTFLDGLPDETQNESPTTKKPKKIDKKQVKPKRDAKKEKKTSKPFNY